MIYPTSVDLESGKVRTPAWWCGFGARAHNRRDTLPLLRIFLQNLSWGVKEVFPPLDSLVVGKHNFGLLYISNLV